MVEFLGMLRYFGDMQEKTSHKTSEKAQFFCGIHLQSMEKYGKIPIVTKMQTFT